MDTAFTGAVPHFPDAASHQVNGKAYTAMKRKRRQALLQRAAHTASELSTLDNLCGLCRVARNSAVTRPPLHVVQPASGIRMQQDVYGNPVCPECGTVWRENKLSWPPPRLFHSRIRSPSSN